MLVLRAPPGSCVPQTHLGAHYYCYCCCCCCFSALRLLLLLPLLPLPRCRLLRPIRQYLVEERFDFSSLFETKEWRVSTIRSRKQQDLLSESKSAHRCEEKDSPLQQPPQRTTVYVHAPCDAVEPDSGDETRVSDPTFSVLLVEASPSEPGFLSPMLGRSLI